MIAVDHALTTRAISYRSGFLALDEAFIRKF
jgi:hypothetical protein